jgi:LemA protein
MPGMTMGILLIFGQTIVRSYNRLVLLRERVKNSASEISVQLKKRADLLPRLEEIVKGYAKHEAKLNQLIANMRADLLFYPIDQGRKKDLIAVLEAYPKLNASENFKSLMLSIEKLEESIAQVREFYNRSVLKYNNLCQQFPTVVISKIGGMAPAEFMNRYKLD